MTPASGLNGHNGHATTSNSTARPSGELTRAGHAVAHPAGRGQPGQPARGHGLVETNRPHRCLNQQRPGSPRRARSRTIRRGAHGHPDARDGRPGGHAGNPPPLARQTAPALHHRHDRQRHDRRPGEMPGSGHGRLHQQTRQSQPIENRTRTMLRVARRRRRRGHPSRPTTTAPRPRRKPRC